ncbi:MAG: YdcF family protein [bacterium]|nr:YdcF family protein [bacterium]
MFFILSKVVTFILDPLVWITGILVVAGLRARFSRSGKIVYWGLFLLIYFLSTPFVSNKLMYRLEHSITPEFDGTHYEAAVVLTGVVNLNLSDTTAVEFSRGVDRILRGMELLKSGTVDYLIISGGTGSLFGSNKSEARVLKKFALRWGLPEEKILVESGSRNTRENAERTKKVIEKQGFKKFLLITSAFHMKRSKGCFKAVGLNPTALPVDYFVSGRVNDFRDFLPASGALELSYIYIHENVGILIYGILGHAEY